MEKRELKQNSRIAHCILYIVNTHYTLIIIGLLFIIAGLWLMSGESTTETAFNPEIFSERRIRLAPIVCLIGYLIEGIACMNIKAYPSPPKGKDVL